MLFTALTLAQAATPFDRAVVAAGGNSTYTTRADGSFWAWGANTSGQLGTGGGSYAGTAVEVGLTQVRSIAGGYQFALAVDGDGEVWAFGANNAGQLGVGDTTTRTTPVPLGMSGILSEIGRAHV